MQLHCGDEPMGQMRGGQYESEVCVSVCASVSAVARESGSLALEVSENDSLCLSGKGLCLQETGYMRHASLGQ